jgi:pimeloyl-ACP methyl ester carboxylesterase
MLAFISVRLTDQPQRWAVVPAVFMGVGGLLLLVFGSPAHGVLKWLWPPALLVLVVWMFTRSRQQLHSRSRWLLYPVFAALLLASIGGAYETVSEAVDPTDNPITSELIDVGGHSLHLRCSGSGSPTVILEPGAGEMSAGLAWIEPAVADDTRVCVYDRAGRGWSDAADAPQDAAGIATDLHTLLERGDLPGPYLLVGHSFGGLYVLTFAALYPDEVAGMVLVDSTAPASTPTPAPTTPGDSGTYELEAHVSALLSSTARLGVGRLLARADYGSLPSQARDEARASLATVSHFRSTIDEYLLANASTKQAAALTDLDGKPLVVLTAGTGSSAGWMADQDLLATLSTNSAHRVIEGATHAALLHDEQYAAQTTQAILDVISSVQNDAPLVGE